MIESIDEIYIKRATKQPVWCILVKVNSGVYVVSRFRTYKEARLEFKNSYLPQKEEGLDLGESGYKYRIGGETWLRYFD